MGPPAASYVPTVRSPIGEHSKSGTRIFSPAGAIEEGAPATYVGMCHIFCESVEAFQAGFGPHAQEIMADIPNYSDRYSDLSP